MTSTRVLQQASSQRSAYTIAMSPKEENPELTYINNLRCMPGPGAVKANVITLQPLKRIPVINNSVVKPNVPTTKPNVVVKKS